MRLNYLFLDGDLFFDESENLFLALIAGRLAIATDFVIKPVGVSAAPAITIF